MAYTSLELQVSSCFPFKHLDYGCVPPCLAISSLFRQTEFASWRHPWKEARDSQGWTAAYQDPLESGRGLGVSNRILQRVVTLPRQSVMVGLVVTMAESATSRQWPDLTTSDRLRPHGQGPRVRSQVFKCVPALEWGFSHFPSPNYRARPAFDESLTVYFCLKVFHISLYTAT